MRNIPVVEFILEDGEITVVTSPDPEQNYYTNCIVDAEGTAADILKRQGYKNGFHKVYFSEHTDGVITKEQFIKELEQC